MWPKKLLLLSFKRDPRGKEQRSKTTKDLKTPTYPSMKESKGADTINERNFIADVFIYKIVQYL